MRRPLAIFRLLALWVVLIPTRGPGQPSIHAEIALTDTLATAQPEKFGAHVQLEINHPRHLDSSFEPITFNRRFEVRGGGPTHASIANAHVFDTMRDGYLNGAVVFVYRFEGENYRLIRKSTVSHHWVGDPADPASPGRFDFTDTAEPPQSGDVAFLRIEWLQPPLERAAERLRPFLGDVWFTRTPGAGYFQRDPTTQPPLNGGRSSLRVVATGTEELWVESHGQFDGAYQDFYPTLVPGQTYRLTFWARAAGPSRPQLQVNFTSLYQNLRATAQLTADWQEYHQDFIAPEWRAIAPVSVCQLRLRGPATAWIDNLSVQAIDVAPFAPAPRQVNDLLEFNIGSLRTFGAFNDSQTLSTWTDLPLLTTVNWSVDTGGGAAYLNKLPTLLQVAKTAGGIPWLVVGGQITEEEWPQLIEYLAAPFDPLVDTAATKPWAAKRHAQGQTRPWLDEFPRVRLEFCNEAWNYLFPYNYDALTYGRLARYFFNRARSSPWWSEERFETLLNGWLLQPGINGFGAVARGQVPFGDAVGVTAYVGGWERGQFVGGSEFTDIGLQDTLLYPAYDQIQFHRQHAVTRQALAAAGSPYRIYVYEAGPGYSLPNGSQPFIPVQQRYGKSLAAGVCTLDMLLFNSLLGYGAQNYFTFGYGFNWTSHALPARGGHPYPSWSALQLRNRYGKGDLVAAQVIEAPAADVIRPSEGYDVRNIPLVQPYAFKSGLDYSLFVLSRSLTNTIPTRLRLPFRTAAQVLVHRLTGDPRANNLEEYVIRESPSEDITASLEAGGSDDPNARLRFELPPGSVFVFEFKGTTSRPPGNPDVTIGPAPGQSTSSSMTPLRFTIAFDRSITGFTAEDVTIEGTADASAAEVHLEEVEPILGLGLTYVASVSGLRSSGSVRLRIPAGRVFAREDGSPNQESNGSATFVRFLMAAPEDRLVSEESFDPKPDESPLAPALHQLRDGTGFTGSWGVQNEDVSGYRLGTAVPLSFGRLRTAGPYASGGANFLTAGRALDVATAFQSWRAPNREPAVIGRPGTVIWLSALLRKEANNDQPMLLGLADTTFPWVLPDWRIGIGFAGAASRSGSARFWSLLVRSPALAGDVVLKSARPVTAGTTILAVLKVEFGVRDRVSLFLNPASLGGGEPDHPDLTYLTVPGPSDLSFRTLAFYGGDGASQGAVDEIRLGDSFAAVTPVTGPAPPATPRNLVVEAAGANALRVEWQDFSTDETGFEVQRRSPNSDQWTTLTLLPSGVSGYVDQGLAPGNLYTYRVRATNTWGGSAWSGPASEATRVAPLLLAIRPLDSSRVELSWSSTPSGILQAVGRLSPPAGWVTLPESPIVTDGTNRLTLPVGGEQRYFRLLGP